MGGGLKWEVVSREGAINIWVFLVALSMPLQRDSTEEQSAYSKAKDKAKIECESNWWNVMTNLDMTVRLSETIPFLHQYHGPYLSGEPICPGHEGVVSGGSNGRSRSPEGERDHSSHHNGHDGLARGSLGTRAWGVKKSNGMRVKSRHD